jgi:hypothetical protein
MTLLALTPALVAYGWWATGLRPFAATTTAAVVGAGVVAIAVGSRGRWRAVSAVGVRDGVVWILLLGALAAWQLAAFFQQPRSQHPTLSSMANTVLDTHLARTLAFLAWLVGAARLARR